jgi:uncharacterized protein YegL
LTEAEEGGIPIHSMQMEKTIAPVGRNRPDPQLIAELPPIPTIEAPAVPEEREMVLATSGKGGSLPNTSSATAPLWPARKVEKKSTEIKWDKPLLGKSFSLDPLVKGFGQGKAFLEADRGFAILLAIDTSGSVKGSPLEGIKNSAVEFVNLLGEGDRSAVITFHDRVDVVVPFTADKKRLSRAISNLRSEGKNTVLFDALSTAFSQLREEKGKSKFVLLFSDGKDEGSRSNAQEVIQRARQLGIAVFCLGYSRVEKKYLATLESLSESTGGVFAETPHLPEIIDLFRSATVLRGRKKT